MLTEIQIENIKSAEKIIFSTSDKTISREVYGSSLVE